VSILNRYVTREILRLFAFVLIGAAFFYLVVDFVEKIDDFMERGLPFSRAFLYFANKIPFIIGQISPIALFLSMLIALGLMARENEILALKAAGINVRRLLHPVINIALVAALLFFLFSEFVIPGLTERANRIWYAEVRREAAVVTRTKDIWVKGNRAITYVAYFNRAKNTAFGIRRFEFDDAFRPVLRIDAEKGVYTGDRWRLEKGMTQRLAPSGETYRTESFTTRTLSLDLSPAALKRVAKKSEEMGFLELYRYVRAVETEGYDAGQYRVDLFAKTARPVFFVVLGLIACVISFRLETWGVMRRIGLGIVIAFLYWLSFSFLVSIGYGGLLPPMIAAWSANLLFGAGAVFLLFSKR
jgi:lipopolysaccharide export system permease protein